MAELKVISGPKRGKLFRVGHGISTIGREQTNSVRINDYEISRRHAELHIRESECTLIDLGSSNGTLVNEEPISNRQLATGDQIRLGQTVLEFHAREFGTDHFEQNDTVRKIDDESNAIDDTLNADEGSVSQFLKTKSNLEVLYHAALATGSYQSTENLLHRILDLVFCWISAHRSCILIREDEQESLYAKSIDQNEPEKYTTEPFDIEYAVIKYVFRRKEGVVVNDILNDDRFPYVIEGESLQNRQIICAPIKSRYGIRGVIYADKSKLPVIDGDAAAPPFDEQQLKLLFAIGLHAAVAIENADHYAMMLQSERVTAVGSAMSSLSHHIKNILQSINGGNHLIEEGISNQQMDLIQNGWKIVQKNQHHLSNLVMDMLSYSKTTVPRIESANLIDLVVQVVTAIEDTARPANVDVTFNAPHEAINVPIEPELMRRALYNVIYFCINSCRENSGGKVDININCANDDVHLVIRDNGIGMNRQELNCIFDPLAISERSSRIGLGMAVARKLVVEMSGSIEAAANEDRPGSNFKITLPQASRPAV